MERSDILVAGVALGAASLAVAATSQSAQAQVSSKPLAAAASQNLIVNVPSRVYAIKNTISWTSSGDTGGVPWGLNCQGATLKSLIVNGGDVIRLTVTNNNNVRY